MLETIREFALERLGRDELQDLERRLTAWFRRFAEAAEPELRGASQKDSYERIDAELPNIRIALATSLAVDGEDAAAIAAAVWRFWWHRGHLPEACAWLDRTLEVKALRPVLRARLLNARGALALDEQKPDLARRCQEESLALFEQAGDRVGAMYALGDLSVIYFIEGDHDRGLELLTDVASRARELDDAWALATAMQNLANFRLHFRHEVAESEEAYAEACAAAAEAGDAALHAAARCGSGQAALAGGDLTTAHERFCNAAREALEIGAQFVVADALEGLAATAASFAPGQSGRLLGCAETLREEIGVEHPPEDWALIDSKLARVRGLAAFETGFRDGRLLSPAEALAEINAPSWRANAARARSGP